jgi:hypothetical protein
MPFSIYIYINGSFLYIKKLRQYFFEDSQGLSIYNILKKKLMRIITLY